MTWRPLLAWAAVLIAVVTALNLVFIPFHAPDDIDHFERAAMLARGEIWPQTRPGQHSGGMIDTGLQRYVEQELPALDKWPRIGALPAPLGPDAAARAATWSGEVSFTPFMAAAITYLPLIYLPQTVAIWIGQALGLSIESTIFWARELNGLTAIGIVFGALAVWPIPGALVMLLLFLPKTLLHFASNSPDPIYYGVVLAIVGILCRASASRWAFAAIAACFLIVCPVRPPAVALALPALAVAWRQRAWAGALLMAASIGLAFAWTLTILGSTVSDACADDAVPLATKIVAFLRSSFSLIPATFVDRGSYFLVSLIGELGWGRGPQGVTTMLPDWIYPAALGLFIVALRVDLAEPLSLPVWLRTLFGIAAAGMVFAIFMALYVTCSSYGLPIVRGVQGRYFVPVLICLVPVFAGTMQHLGSWRRAYDVGLFAFAMAGFGTLVHEALRIYWIR